MKKGRHTMANSVGRRSSPRAGIHPITPPGLGLPFVNCEGTLRECGRMLGRVWKEVLTLEADRMRPGGAWWKDRRYTPLISRHAPHLPDLYCAMAEGAGIDENRIAPRAPRDDGGCTSFAAAAEATLEGLPISGQNKDVSIARGMQLVVLRMKMSDAPSMLTLTYPGWLFGHGFVRGGTAVFRNSLYAGVPEKGLPFDVWGILALHCPSVETVAELTGRCGVRVAGHVTVADERGGILGIECAQGGIAFLKPRQGIYTHANGVLSAARLRRTEVENPLFRVADSLHRTERLRARLSAERGRITAQTAFAALMDHDGYPASVCRHQSVEAVTSASVVVEPARGLLHATRGSPCQAWPVTYQL